MRRAAFASVDLQDLQDVIDCPRCEEAGNRAQPISPAAGHCAQPISPAAGHCRRCRLTLAAAKAWRLRRQMQWQ